mgnify:CR=1 FL=1
MVLLAASRVEGNLPEYESFHYELWKVLVNKELNFDFIGTVKDKGFYPDNLGNVFDYDYEGRSGWTAEEIKNNIHGWIKKTGSPHIIVFSSPGGNDALINLPYESTISHINKIISIVQDYNNTCKIILELPAPSHSEIFKGKSKEYFNKLQNDILTIASTQTNEKSEVLTVNMFKGFWDSMLADDAHYKTYGAKFIATRHFEILKPLLNKK